ncbi:MAG: SLC13 family permease [Gammaproteobacteria bacterium]|jgi:di/tricarboxylate transporter
MPVDAWIATAVTVGCLILLIATEVGADLILLAGLTLLLALGVVTPQQALAGFSNEGMLAVAALFVVAAGLRETGALGFIVSHLFGRPQSTRAAQLRLMVPVTVLSAFLNNTPVVASFLPAVLDWAKKQRISPSRLMMPLSFAAILGGTTTIIGTSTNLVVNGLLVTEPGQRGLGFFELAWVGIPITLVGLVYVLAANRWLLPERIPPMEQLRNAREYTVEMLVDEPSPLDGMTIEEAGLRHLPGLFLVEIDRDGQIIGAVGPEERLRAGDRLVFAGITDSVVDLQRIKGLSPATNQVFKLDSPRPNRTMIEAVVSRNSAVTGRTIKEARFRNRYNAVVIAVARDGQRVAGKIGAIEIHAGDTLLLEADRSFLDQHRNSRDFLLLRPIEGASVPRHERSWLAWLILAAVVIAATFGWTSLVTAAFLGAGAMVLARCCSASAARKSVEIDVLLVIAASFGIGKALEISGAAGALAGGLVELAGNQPLALLAAVYVATAVLTAIITNNAAAVLMFPLAWAAVHGLDLDFMPFAVCIAMAASASFATPIGYQTNLMVYGPGGYRFGDYLRFGLPLNVLVGVVTLVVIPLVWPLAG